MGSETQLNINTEMPDSLNLACATRFVSRDVEILGSELDLCGADPGPKIVGSAHLYLAKYRDVGVDPTCQIE